MTEIIVIMNFPHRFKDSKVLSILIKDAFKDIWDSVIGGGFIVDGPVAFRNSKTVELIESERKVGLVFGVGFMNLLIESLGIFDIFDNDIACLESIFTKP